MTRLRVATIPDEHPYIAAVLPADVERVRFRSAGGPWEPSPLLAARADRLLAEVDVLHVHFGYESLTGQAMRSWIAGLRPGPAALVLTVHDLRNPHQLDSARHDEHLGDLIAAADEVITLTPGAAAEIARRWQRSARVLAHPCLLVDSPPVDLADGLGAGLQPVVGIHFKSLRANIVEPHRIVRGAVAGAQAAGAALRVDVHPGVLPSDVLPSELLPSELLSGASRPSEYLPAAAVIHEHPRFSDADLLAYLQGLSVSVLPYQFGTHSGWLELCRDLGVAVVVPDCGFYSEQWPASYRYRNNDRTGLDEASLSAAVTNAARNGRPLGADRAERERQRRTIRAEHAAIYHRVACSSAARRR